MSDWDEYEDEEEEWEDEQDEVEECILQGGGVLGAGPKCVIGGCPYWGGDGICLLEIENYVKTLEAEEK